MEEVWPKFGRKLVKCETSPAARQTCFRHFILFGHVRLVLEFGILPVARWGLCRFLNRRFKGQDAICELASESECWRSFCILTEEGTKVLDNLIGRLRDLVVHAELDERGNGDS